MALETDFEKGVSVARRRHTVEQIIGKLREAEVELAKGMKTPEISASLITSHNPASPIRWRPMRT